VADELRTASGRSDSLAAPLLYGALRRLGLSAHLGPLLSCERVIDGADRALAAGSGAVAVDTESAFLAAKAPAGSTVAVRAIVDTPSAPLLRAGTVGRAIRALRATAPAIDQWAAAVGDREVVLAAPRSFCAGVERAVEIVERALQRFGAPVFVRHQIVHNAHVVGDLERQGAVFVNEIDDVPPGAAVVLSAHGVAPSVRRAAEARGLRVVDATCPLVAKVHSEVRRFAMRGKTVFLIGHAEHDEVVGTRGEADRQVVVVADPAEAQRVQVPDPDNVGYVMQTTLAVDEAERTAAALRERFPALTAPPRDDICYATTNRQSAVRAIARRCDLILVVGSANSSNCRRLVEITQRLGTAAHLVEDATDVDLRWLAGIARIGVTAGASAPPDLVDELVRCLSGLGRITVDEVNVAAEDVRFALPKEVS
jgi:4-hydroxy-3-methylbut-2-enyl diphosphate reductase